MESERKIIKVGSRTSQLALIQTNQVIDLLKASLPHLQFEIIKIQTKGDKILNVSLSNIGDKGLFTRELEDGLEEGTLDFAVHSLKDIPTRLPNGLCIGAISKRHEQRDCLVVNAKHKGCTLETLPHGSVIGTSSLRRIAQIKRLFPHFQFVDIRGNLNSRLAKLDNPEQQREKNLPVYDAIILAVAGLERLGFSDRIEYVLPSEYCLHAVGQGALAVECRENDNQLLEWLKVVHDENTAACCRAERSFLRYLEGGCQVPVGVFTEIVGNQIVMNGIVLNLDGSKWVSGKLTGDKSEPEVLGTQLAKDLEGRGARDILKEVLEKSSSTKK